jgi:membrane protease YdiL (CAAX protease family)
MKKIIDFLKTHPLVSGVIGVAFITLSVRFMGPRMNGNLEGGVFRLAFALSGMVFLYLISGEKTFEKCERTTGYVCKVLLPTLLFPLFTFFPSILTNVQGGVPLRSDWLLQLLFVAFLCLCVGLMEEVMARGLINDSLVYQFRNTKKIFLIVAVVDIVVFGVIHMIGSKIDTPAAFIMAVMKALSSGAGGLCYLFLYWKTRNLWGVAIMHGVYDFIATSPQVLFQTAETTTITANYVSSDAETASIRIIGLGVDLLINAAIALWIWKKHMKDVDFETMRETW